MPWAAMGRPSLKPCLIRLRSAAAFVAEQYGAEVRDLDTIAAADDIDAVIICTLTDLHAQLIERFARAGKAIFCEKPIDLDSARVRACLDVVDETGATLMVGFNRRFDPHFMAVKAAIELGQIGTPEMGSLLRATRARRRRTTSSIQAASSRHDDS